MNWKEIKKKYPKAYKSFGNWINRYAYNTDRDLYDFFDEQGIPVSVYHIVRRYGKFFSVKIFNPISKKTVRILSVPFEIRKSRFKMEKQAFLKAFEILEKKVKS